MLSSSTACLGSRLTLSSGRTIIFAGLKNFNGKLEFYNVDDLEPMVTAEHFIYVATSVISDRGIENGFNIWSFHGKLLYKISKDQFYRFLWRPSPPPLSQEKEVEIAKNLKKYSEEVPGRGLGRNVAVEQAGWGKVQGVSLDLPFSLLSSGPPSESRPSSCKILLHRAART
ncbi:hypothetical protein MLD38_012542 [Melastoma candidum]|uniref:Uncharacterized protein n=1 Tax=Melastoma candidum TaxID=119954 RepID=A0ACB9R8H0_9MYRT|nr:hypothetical protein MLD38_012542 [Melastoma candidum]